MRAFVSPLAADLRGFLDFKRALGRRYGDRPSGILHSLDRFFAHGYRARRFDQDLLAWLAHRAVSRRPISLLWDIAIGRELCKYLRRRYPRRFIREPQWPHLPRPPEFVPTILPVAQVRKLLARARRLDRPIFRRHLYRMLILVLYCTGLRLGEALALRLKDVDVRAGTLFIAESKGRSRWVPFHPSLKQEIERYLIHRQACAPSDPDQFFFVQRHRTRLPKGSASSNLTSLLRKAGLKPLAGRIGPRTHDLRHTFAVHRLTKWYRQGLEIDGRLPWLSAYMGHTNILGTEIYLGATPELLQLAGDRFRRHVHAKRRSE